MESETRGRTADSIVSRFLQWLTTDRATRYPLPGLLAYHWSEGTPKACSVGDISSTGMYVFTDERWFPGSVIPMTLQRGIAPEQDSEDWIAVLVQVVRSGTDGCGVAFVFSESARRFANEIPPERVADHRSLRRFLKHLKHP